MKSWCSLLVLLFLTCGSVFAQQPCEAPNPVVIETAGVLSTSEPFTTYQWYKDNMLIPGATARQYSPTASGMYTVQVTALSSSFSVEITGRDMRQTINFSIAPNPSDGNILLRFPQKGAYDVTVFDVMGREAYKRSFSAGDDITQTLDLTGFRAGLYNVRVSNDQSTTTKALLIR